MKTLYFDCFSGAAGDMIVGALIDLGADFTQIRDGLASLNVEGYEVATERVKKKGVMATKFNVLIEEHGHPHRHLKHIVEIIENSDVPEPVKRASIDTFRRIGDAEAEVHGTTPDKVHFHEVGAVDSIVDIVGSHLALHQLAPERIDASPLHVGAGTVQCAHGLMPVPAPATALLLKGVPTYSEGVDGELVTPTGAALIAQLAQNFGPQPPMTVENIGAGAGTKDLPDRPNILRVLSGQTAGISGATESVTVIEATIDDMNPELFPPLVKRLLDVGARDAFLTHVLGKKGRPAYLLTILADDKAVTGVTRELFRNSTTIGLRMHREDRICLNRLWKNAHTPWGAVRVKIALMDGAVTNAAPEFDDCARVADEAGVTVREVYDAARAAAQKEEWTDA